MCALNECGVEKEDVEFSVDVADSDGYGSVRAERVEVWYGCHDSVGDVL